MILFDGYAGNALGDEISVCKEVTRENLTHAEADVDDGAVDLLLPDVIEDDLADTEELIEALDTMDDAAALVMEAEAELETAEDALVADDVPALEVADANTPPCSDDGWLVSPLDFLAAAMY